MKNLIKKYKINGWALIFKPNKTWRFCELKPIIYSGNPNYTWLPATQITIILENSVIK